eukprot:3941441-Rhodomonas_salina.7
MSVLPERAWYYLLRYAAMELTVLRYEPGCTARGRRYVASRSKLAQVCTTRRKNPMAGTIAAVCCYDMPVLRLVRVLRRRYGMFCTEAGYGATSSNRCGHYQTSVELRSISAYGQRASPLCCCA